MQAASIEGKNIVNEKCKDLGSTPDWTLNKLPNEVEGNLQFGVSKTEEFEDLFDNTSENEHRQLGLFSSSSLLNCSDSNLSSTLLEFPLSPLFCRICKKEITKMVRLRCAECQNFDLCVDCFCLGSEIQLSSTQAHFNYHKYIPCGKIGTPLYTPDWSADEEIMLLEGVSNYGFGNWNEVAQLVNSVAIEPKRSGQCERHYFSVYLNSNTSPLPDESDHGKLYDHRQSKEIAGHGDDKDKDHSLYKKNKCSGNKNGSNKSRQNKLAHQIIGYWPLRGDFDIEYDNGAELILADMEFKEEEPAQERELKLQIIEIYNSKLDERIYRKKTAIERGLLDVKALQQKEKKRSKEERELYNVFKPLARFHSDEEHERFIQLLIEEKKIRSRLKQLQEWKSLGLQSIDEVRLYEEEKKRRDDLKFRANAQYSFMCETQSRSQRRNRSNCTTKTEEADAQFLLKEKQFIPNSILQFPGIHLLDENEKGFCESMQLPPVFYLMAKKILLHEASRNVHFDKNNYTKTMRLDGQKAGQLYDFYLGVCYNSSGKAEMATCTHPNLLGERSADFDGNSVRSVNNEKQVAGCNQRKSYNSEAIRSDTISSGFISCCNSGIGIHDDDNSCCSIRSTRSSNAVNAGVVVGINSSGCPISKLGNRRSHTVGVASSRTSKTGYT